MPLLYFSGWELLNVCNREVCTIGKDLRCVYGSLSLGLVLLGSSARLAVVVEDRLGDLNVFFLAETVCGLVLGMILLHPGQALTSSQASLFLVLETLCPL